jgi:hypothetical protein
MHAIAIGLVHTIATGSACAMAIGLAQRMPSPSA